MSETAAVADGHKTGKAPSLGKFERFLTLWVGLCIIVGIGLGQAVPGVFHAHRNRSEIWHTRLNSARSRRKSRRQV